MRTSDSHPEDIYLLIAVCYSCLPHLQHSEAATDPCSLSESGYPFCSSVSVPAAESFDVGKYTCSHAISSHYPRPQNDTAKEEVYVYVKGKQILETNVTSRQCHVITLHSLQVQRAFALHLLTLITLRFTNMRT